MSLAAPSRIAVGSTNPVKIGAVAGVVRQDGDTAAVVGVAVPSGVRDQPWVCLPGALAAQ